MEYQPMCSQHLMFQTNDKFDERPLVEIIVARLGGKMRATDRHYGRIYAVEDWVYTVSGSHSHDRSEPWRKLKQRMLDQHAIEGYLDIYEGSFAGKSNTKVSLDGCTELGLYYVFQFVYQEYANDIVKQVRLYLAAAGVFVDTMRLDVDRAADYIIEQYRKQGKSELWIHTRLNGKISREAFIEALQLAIYEYKDQYAGIATNDIYVGLWNRVADVLKDQLNVNKRRSLRDHLSGMALSYLSITEDYCAIRLKDQHELLWPEARAIVKEVAKIIGSQVRQTEQSLGRDMITEYEKLPDNHHYHDMIEELGEHTIGDDGKYISGKLGDGE